MTNITLNSEHKRLRHALLNWYSLNYRDLPWRQTKDPFKIWLSEIILQQTRVSQGLPYYQKFVDRFDNVFEFAQADEAEVLKLWQGLGYYSRARNMQHCATTVVEKYNGVFPDNYKELLTLKGIGKYTAAAVSSICFDEKMPTIDGNVYRILSRIFGIQNDISKTKSYQTFFDTAYQIMPDHNCGEFNQAMMELGATVCLPKNPDCSLCPVQNFCYANAKNMQQDFPVKSKTVKIKKRKFDYYIIENNGSVLLKTRVEKDIWIGLNEFLLIEEDPEKSDLPFKGSHISTSNLYSHQLTHQKLNIHFHRWKVEIDEFSALEKKFNMRSIHTSEIDKFAVPKPIELFLKKEYLLVN